MKTNGHMPFWRRVCRVAGLRLFHWAENNGIADVRRNGERWLVKEAMRAHNGRGAGRPFVVIDGGANAGDYTAMLLELAQACKSGIEVHAFEPSDTARNRLLERFEGCGQLTVIGKALGERAGSAILQDGAAGSEHASLLMRAGFRNDPGKAVQVDVIPLGEYLREAGIARVDLLKLDIEGYELAALRGLGDALVPECVRAIQFEYGGTTMDAGVTLGQIYQLLQGRGYRVAKLLPSGLAVRDYAPWMDHYSYANYVAIAPEAVA